MGPKTRYNNEKVASRNRCYILEHIQNLDKVLADLERVEVIITGGKSHFCRADIKIMGYICDV